MSHAQVLSSLTLGIVSSAFTPATAVAINGADVHTRTEYREQCGREIVRIHGAKGALIGAIFYSAALDYGTGKEGRSEAMRCIPQGEQKYASDFWSCFTRAFKDGKGALALTKLSTLAKAYPAKAKAPVVQTPDAEIDGSEAPAAVLTHAAPLVDVPLYTLADAIAERDAAIAALSIVTAQRDALQATLDAIAEEYDVVVTGALESSAVAA